MAALFVVPAQAAASQRTYTVNRFGDLYFFNDDLKMNGILGLGLRRVYNSFNNDQVGIFGNGWSIIYEEFLKIQDDGSMVVHEWGGGASNHFTPKTSSLRPHKEIVDEIMRAAAATGQFGSEQDRQNYKLWLERDANEEDQWEHFVSLGLLKPQDPPVGSTFFSGRFGAEFVTRVPEGYQRETKQNGKTFFEAFDKSGRLTRLWNANHDFVALSYNKVSGQLENMADNSGNRIAFRFANGLVSRTEDSRGNVALYRYKNSNLVSVELNGKFTRYYYDSENRLIAIHYLAGTSMQMKYNKDGLLTFVKDTDGTATTYAWAKTVTQACEVDTVDTLSKAPNGEIHHRTDQYFYVPNASQGYVSKWVDTYDGAVVSATYDRDLNELTYTTSKGTTYNTYDDLDRKIEERTPSGTVFKWTYDPATRKVSTFSATTNNNDVTTEHFEYDPKGNLVHAFDSNGLDFVLSYDPYGRITGVSSGRLQLAFEFADIRMSSPTTVVLAGVGAVTVSYNTDGTVGSAQSNDGAAVVNKVKAALQAVNNVIGDAGVQVVSLPTSSQ